MSSPVARVWLLVAVGAPWGTCHSRHGSSPAYPSESPTLPGAAELAAFRELALGAPYINSTYPQTSPERYGFGPPAGVPDMFLLGCTKDNCKGHTTWTDAAIACNQYGRALCGGVVQVTSARGLAFQCRQGVKFYRSGSRERAWARIEAGQKQESVPDPPVKPPPPPPPPPSPPRELTGDPYTVLGIARSVSMGEIRRVYRSLALKYHPDRNHGPGAQEAADTFAKINGAYEILGDPEKRAAFDDFGSEHQDGFNSYWEYKQSGSKGGSNDFYQGDSMVQRLTADNFDKRTAVGNWLLEFYAPWCKPCKMATPVVKQAADRLDGVVEVGAINAVTNDALKRRFNVQAFPSFFLYSSEHQIYLKFPWKGPGTFVADVQPWVANALAEWETLFHSTAVERFTVAGTFDLEVLNSTDMWVVMFTSGAQCPACIAALPNFYRLSIDLAGVARVGVVDCSTPSVARVCTDQVRKDQRIRVPPYFYVFPRGTKLLGAPAGEALFDGSGAVEPHVVFPVIAMIARNALVEATVENNAVSKGDSDAFEYGPPPTPPPPPPVRPQYQAPEPKRKFVQVGSSGKRTARLT